MVLLVCLHCAQVFLSVRSSTAEVNWLSGTSCWSSPSACLHRQLLRWNQDAYWRWCRGGPGGPPPFIGDWLTGSSSPAARWRRTLTRFYATHVFMIPPSSSAARAPPLPGDPPRCVRAAELAAGRSRPTSAATRSSSTQSCAVLAGCRLKDVVFASRGLGGVAPGVAVGPAELGKHADPPWSRPTRARLVLPVYFACSPSSTRPGELVHRRFRSGWGCSSCCCLRRPSASEPLRRPWPSAWW